MLFFELAMTKSNFVMTISILVCCRQKKEPAVHRRLITLIQVYHCELVAPSG